MAIQKSCYLLMTRNLKTNGKRAFLQSLAITLTMTGWMEGPTTCLTSLCGQLTAIRGAEKEIRKKANLMNHTKIRLIIIYPRMWGMPLTWQRWKASTRSFTISFRLWMIRYLFLEPIFTVKCLLIRKLFWRKNKKNLKLNYRSKKKYLKRRWLVLSWKYKKRWKVACTFWRKSRADLTPSNQAYLCRQINNLENQ